MTEEATGVAPDGPEASDGPDASDGRPRRTGRTVTVVLLVLAVGAGAAVSRVDTWWPTLTPTTSRGTVGEVVTAGPVRVRVDDVRTGTTLDDDGSGPLTTDGVWVVVDLAVSGTTGEASVEVVELRDAAGRDHEASRRVGNQVLSTFADPDVPEAGTVAVEVPARALEGDLVLRVLTEHQDADLDRPQAIAEVDLGRVAPPAAGDSVETVRPALVPGGWDA
ncbi:hypothetical protein [Cellulosimicrobium funkei]|uniref:DUF4352 domain-containing protein n=1 Tax=Cellulosimicrobium funkei TaxID=264251 RepID=A0A4Y8R798_9MICO|nr:hypothetical protein [Cellulosimicrobium funkei]TFF17095.1 hypothetical protein E1O70_02700 [Cellulosimicrobium funkei]TGA70953.1 hypothetical protein EQW79_014755 [Cellulosimicrobium terreum]